MNAAFEPARSGLLEVLEDVRGCVLVLRVGSRSGRGVEYRVTIEYDGSGQLLLVQCNCLGGRFGRCHHIKSVWDLAGRTRP